MRSFIRDSVWAFRNNIPVSFDANAAPLIGRLSQLAGLTSNLQKQDLLYSSWLDFDLPDFSMLHWDEVVEVRGSPAGQDFRRLLANLSLEDSGVDLTDESAVRRWAMNRIGEVLMEEL